ncbi:helix-turn-helix domain-containing protein [Moraxella sp. FZLJ2107]|uniref:helix-turn-helix domain-containing protein n=1 Tax=unclassified Moraxella TaxID=2685852 RepID=UPI0020C8937F|nr:MULTISPECIES: helix-turn-helix domain-containing protein [unclassified Moraxella]UTO05666.1 helix-turn-helix domain-containing protein [Moraxella sp. FZLJ2107]UTO22402.1 helix-turn-helix domain-containing protein [Moraxella sp. FZLJ2109]
MTKYTMDFKLSVIQHYLTGHSYNQTAKFFGIESSIIQNWVRLYQTHGIDGIRPRTSKASYSPAFKHTAVLQLLSGKSMPTVATELNISSPSVLFQWLKAYQTHGIMGLTPKPKGRRPMSKSTNKSDKVAKATKTSKVAKTAKVDRTDKTLTNEHAELLRRIQYLEAENAYLKKLDALIRQKHNASSPKKK